jgi:hypothetical protein
MRRRSASAALSFLDGRQGKTAVIQPVRLPDAPDAHHVRRRRREPAEAERRQSGDDQVIPKVSVSRSIAAAGTCAAIAFSRRPAIASAREMPPPDVHFATKKYPAKIRPRSGGRCAPPAKHAVGASIRRSVEGGAQQHRDRRGARLAHPPADPRCGDERNDDRQCGAAHPRMPPPGISAILVWRCHPSTRHLSNFGFAADAAAL